MMNPYISWALLLVVAGGLGWYYNAPNPKAKPTVKPAAEKIESATGVKKPKKKAKKIPRAYFIRNDQKGRREARIRVQSYGG